MVKKLAWPKPLSLRKWWLGGSGGQRVDWTLCEGTEKAGLRTTVVHGRSGALDDARTLVATLVVRLTVRPGETTF